MKWSIIYLTEDGIIYLTEDGGGETITGVNVLMMLVGILIINEYYDVLEGQ